MSIATVNEDRVIPAAGKYTSSIFAHLMTYTVILLVISTILLILFGILSVIGGINYYNNAVAAGILELDENGQRIVKDLTAEHIVWMSYKKLIRSGLAYIFLSLITLIPLRWLGRNYGKHTVIIDEEGIYVKKWPRFNKFSSWDGILDITVKPSESVFSAFSKNLKRITIYAMDMQIPIEGLTIKNNQQLGNNLKLFGDSLEERVIDFGYGAQITVVWRRIKRNKVGLLGAILVLFFIFFALTGVVWGIIFNINDLSSQSTKKFGAIWNPVYTGWGSRNKPPSAEHIFGTDENGRDIFSRLLFGAFYSILIGVIATTIAVTIGGVVGSIAGYIGGTVDQIIQRVIEVLSSLPALPILLLISASVTVILDVIKIEGAYYIAVYTIFAFIGWGGFARLIRSEVLGMRNSEFIQAQLVLGSTHWRIVRKHIIPNIFSTIIIAFTLGVAGDIIGVASLAYLGFGSSSTLVWGQDLSEAIGNQPLTYWWGVTFISFFLFLLVLGFNLFGDALRDALDPTLKN